jgi:hypothetical protein
MINVIGQLTDQLWEMYDLISSLLSSVGNFITFVPGDHKKLAVDKNLSQSFLR